MTQHAALEHQMEEEKRSREAKLRDRLAKKRKAKEEEMKQAALSERVGGMPTKLQQAVELDEPSFYHQSCRAQQSISRESDGPMTRPFSHPRLPRCRPRALAGVRRKKLRPESYTPWQVPFWCFTVTTGWSYGTPHRLSQIPPHRA